MIQDVLALAEAGRDEQALLECVRARISAFEHFEGAELLSRTEAGLTRFILAQGLGDIGSAALDALGDERTLRIDTESDMKARGFSTDRPFASLLVLRIGAPGTRAAAIVLSHSRAWSFAGTPLSRIRTIGDVALRLLLSGGGDAQASDDVPALRAEVSRLRTLVSSLETEIAGRHPIASSSQKGGGAVK